MTQNFGSYFVEMRDAKNTNINTLSGSRIYNLIDSFLSEQWKWHQIISLAIENEIYYLFVNKLEKPKLCDCSVCVKYITKMHTIYSILFTDDDILENNSVYSRTFKALNSGSRFSQVEIDIMEFYLNEIRDKVREFEIVK